MCYMARKGIIKFFDLIKSFSHVWLTEMSLETNLFVIL